MERNGVRGLKDRLVEMIQSQQQRIKDWKVNRASGYMGQCQRYLTFVSSKLWCDLKKYEEITAKTS